MSALSLPNPLSCPLPETASGVSGKRYYIREGRFTLRSAIWDHTAKDAPFSNEGIGLDWFSFEFDKPDACTFRFMEDGRETALEAGLDGVARLNSYYLRNTPLDKVLLHGAWTGKDTFSLGARWIETCFSITAVFKFNNKSVEISLKHIWGDYQSHPLREGNAVGMKD